MTAARTSRTARRARSSAGRSAGRARSRAAAALAVVTVCAGLAAGAGLVAVGLGAAKRPAAAPLPTGTADAGSGEAGVDALPGAPPGWQAGLGPDRIRIPVLGVTASIGAAVTDAAGDLVPPVRPDVVGQWSGSAGLGAARGEVTLAGHVNWAGLAPFAFGDLARLVPGDLVYTSDAGGQQNAWRVTAVFARAKSRPLDKAAFAGPAGPRRLALITCGGGYDAATASYDDNVYVLAVPAAPAAPAVPSGRGTLPPQTRPSGPDRPDTG